MFDSTLNPLWQRYILAVQEEVKPALGCTEPIFTGAGGGGCCGRTEGPVERVEIWFRQIWMKNGSGVTVPGTEWWGCRLQALGALGEMPTPG